MLKNKNVIIQASLFSLFLSNVVWAKGEIKFRLATQNNASINNYALEYKDAHFNDPRLEEKRKKLIHILSNESITITTVGNLITVEMIEKLLEYETFKNFFSENNLDLAEYQADFLKFYRANSNTSSFELLSKTKVKLSSINKDYGSRTANTSVQNTCDLSAFFGKDAWPTDRTEFSRFVFDRVLEHLKNNKHLIKFKKEELRADEKGVSCITRLFFYVLYEVDAFTRIFEESALQDLVDVANAYQKSPMGDVELKGENLAIQVKDSDIIALTESDEMASKFLTEKYDRILVSDARTNDSRLLVNSKVFPRSENFSFSNEDKETVNAKYIHLKSHSNYLPDNAKKFIVSDEEIAFARLQDADGNSVYVATLHAGTSGADNIGSIAMIAEKYNQMSAAGPSPLIIAADFNTNNDDSESKDKLRIKDLKAAVAEIAQLLGMKCTVYMPNANTVNKTRAWTTQLNKVNVVDQATRDGFISCLKNEFVDLIQIDVGTPSVGPMGVSEQNASDHARVETEVRVKFLD